MDVAGYTDGDVPIVTVAVDTPSGTMQCVGEWDLMDGTGALDDTCWSRRTGAEEGLRARENLTDGPRTPTARATCGMDDNTNCQRLMWRPEPSRLLPAFVGTCRRLRLTHMWLR